MVTLYNTRRAKRERGFSLIEVLVTSTIIVVISTAILINFRASSTNEATRNRVVSVIVSDIRRAQSMAVSAALLDGELVCGYGISYVDSQTYIIYAGQTGSETGLCADTNRTYQSSIDTVIETIKLANNNFEIPKSFKDIYFEPPNPKTYIQNDASLDRAPEEIIIRQEGLKNCGGGVCTTIKVYTSGKIDVE